MQDFTKHIRHYFSDWTKWEKLWLTTSTLTILALSLYWKDTTIGVVTALTGIWAVVLAAKAKVANFYMSMINVILYAIIAFDQQFFGEVLLNILFYLPMSLIGIMMWQQHIIKQDDIKQLQVKTLEPKKALLLLIGSITAALVFGWSLTLIGSSLPFLNATTAILSVIASFFLIYRYSEQWLLWIVVNVLTIAMWAHAFMQSSENGVVLLMWIAYLINAVYGYFNWRKLHYVQSK